MSEDVLLPLASNIHRLPFETRKAAQVIFSSLFRYKPNVPGPPQDPPVMKYVYNNRPEVISALCYGYEHRESAMPCGGILREALKNDSICAIILYDEPTENGRSRPLSSVDPTVKATGQGIFWKFFDWIDKGAFEVSADAFATFRVGVETGKELVSSTNHTTHLQEILIKHKRLVAHYLLTNFDHFIPLYNSTLLNSPSYVTKRQSINLLSTLLLERSNYSLMTRYVESDANLKLCMNLLRDDRRMINYEGFHIFKVFVANPNKSPSVLRILVNNKEKLLKFLPGFLEDRKDDVQFEDEKAYLVRMISALPSQAQLGALQGQQQQQQGQGHIQHQQAPALPPGLEQGLR